MAAVTLGGASPRTCSNIFLEPLCLPPGQAAQFPTLQLVADPVVHVVVVLPVLDAETDRPLEVLPGRALGLLPRVLRLALIGEVLKDTEAADADGL